MNDPIKAKIQELCPDVMELKFGCEVVVTLRGRRNEGHQLDTKITTLMSDGAWMTLNFGEYQESELTILGSPITLAVVLRAIAKAGLHTVELQTGQFGLRFGADLENTENSYVEYVGWNLEHDNYDAQSQETKAFIGNLLGV